ncbi:MAG: cyanophycin synthetase [Pseudomonadota bacterium]
MDKGDLDGWLWHLERIHSKEIDLGLKRSAAVAARMGLLPLAATVATVAGTNGKGTVAYTTDSLLRASGKTTGRYSSPHLLRFNERITLNGKAVSDERILEAFREIEKARGEITLTYFEFSTLAALWVFAEAAVDVVILEVGLGGRLDAVNIVDADAVAITSIALDHQAWLGDSVDLIAPEKAAVARPNRPVVLAEAAYPPPLFTSIAAIGAKALSAGVDWTWEAEADMLSVNLASGVMLGPVPMPVGLQASNLACAIQLSAVVLKADLSQAIAEAGFAQLQIPGRQQRIVYQQRELIFDVAHNPAAMEALSVFLASNPCAGRTHAIVGLMADKEVELIVKALEKSVESACAIALPGTDRALPAEELWGVLDQAAIAIPQPDFSADAVWRQLMEGTHEGDRIVICGSFHTVASIMPLAGIDAVC